MLEQVKPITYLICYILYQVGSDIKDELITFLHVSNIIIFSCSCVFVYPVSMRMRCLYEHALTIFIKDAR